MKINIIIIKSQKDESHMNLIKIFLLISFFILLTACNQNGVKENNIPNDNTTFNNETNEPVEVEEQIPIEDNANTPINNETSEPVVVVEEEIPEGIKFEPLEPIEVDDQDPIKEKLTYKTVLDLENFKISINELILKYPPDEQNEYEYIYNLPDDYSFKIRKINGVITAFFCDNLLKTEKDLCIHNDSFSDTILAQRENRNCERIIEINNFNNSLVCIIENKYDSIYPKKYTASEIFIKNIADNDILQINIDNLVYSPYVKWSPDNINIAIPCETRRAGNHTLIYNIETKKEIILDYNTISECIETLSLVPAQPSFLYSSLMPLCWNEDGNKLLCEFSYIDEQDNIQQGLFIYNIETNIIELIKSTDINYDNLIDSDKLSRPVMISDFYSFKSIYDKIITSPDSKNLYIKG